MNRRDFMALAGATAVTAALPIPQISKLVVGVDVALGLDSSVVSVVAGGKFHAFVEGLDAAGNFVSEYVGVSGETENAFSEITKFMVQSDEATEVRIGQNDRTLAALWTNDNISVMNNLSGVVLV